jgi:hypothetical protein
MKNSPTSKNRPLGDREKFECAARMTRTMLDQVLAERMSPVELATWLRQLMMHSEDPMSDNEKSAIVCTLAVALLGDADLEFSPSRLMDLVDASDQAIAIGRLV